MNINLEEIDWENRAEWNLIANKLDELAEAVENSSVTALDNNEIKNIKVLQRLIHSTQALANYYRAISDRIVSK